MSDEAGAHGDPEFHERELERLRRSGGICEASGATVEGHRVVLELPHPKFPIASEALMSGQVLPAELATGALRQLVEAAEHIVYPHGVNRDMDPAWHGSELAAALAYARLALAGDHTETAVAGVLSPEETKIVEPVVPSVDELQDVIAACVRDVEPQTSSRGVAQAVHAFLAAREETT